MTTIQKIILFFFAISGLMAFLKGYFEVRQRKNCFGLAGVWSFLGIFVWGDAIVLGLFWAIIGFIFLLLGDWYLFLLTVSIFWAVRSSGEVVYWLNEQFALKHRNPPESLWLYKFFRNDSVWFIYQIYWQCVLVIAIVASVYLISIRF